MATLQKESKTITPEFLEALHVSFIRSLSDKTDSFEHVVMEHLKMSAVYWALTGMAIMGRDLKQEMDTPKIVEWVMECQHSNGGFGGNVGHDPHLLYTLSAIQILALCDELDRLDRDKTAAYVSSLQQPDGSFIGDEWGEVDTRFSYCALSSLSLLGKLGDGLVIDLDKATDYVGRCRNFDGGFGCVPGAESHAGQVFTCIGALAIGKALHKVDDLLLGWWLCERQCDSGGLNGRPEKQADVCYSWWILSALSILGKVDWIDKSKLVAFILACQDAEDGGISDRPANVADVFHTFFGISGLSLLGYFDGQPDKYGHYRRIDPVYALPADLVERLGLPSQILPSLPPTPP